MKNLISKAEGLFGMLTIHLKSLDQWGVIPYLTVQGIHDKIQEYSPCPGNTTPKLDWLSDFQKETATKNKIKFTKL